MDAGAGLLLFLIFNSFWALPSLLMIVIPNNPKIVWPTVAFVGGAGLIYALSNRNEDMNLASNNVLTVLFILLSAFVPKYFAIRAKQAGRNKMSRALPLLGLLGYMIYLFCVICRRCFVSYDT